QPDEASAFSLSEQVVEVAPARARDKAQVQPVGGMDVLLAFGEVVGDGVIVPAQRKRGGQGLAGPCLAADDLKRGRVEMTTGTEVSGAEDKLRRRLVARTPANVGRRHAHQPP